MKDVHLKRGIYIQTDVSSCASEEIAFREFLSNLLTLPSDFEHAEYVIYICQECSVRSHKYEQWYDERHNYVC